NAEWFTPALREGEETATTHAIEEAPIHVGNLREPAAVRGDFEPRLRWRTVDADPNIVARQDDEVARSRHLNRDRRIHSVRSISEVLIEPRTVERRDLKRRGEPSRRVPVLSPSDPFINGHPPRRA